MLVAVISSGSVATVNVLLDIVGAVVVVAVGYVAFASGGIAVITVGGATFSIFVDVIAAFVGVAVFGCTCIGIAFVGVVGVVLAIVSDVLIVVPMVFIGSGFIVTVGVVRFVVAAVVSVAVKVKWVGLGHGGTWGRCAGRVEELPQLVLQGVHFG